MIAFAVENSTASIPFQEVVPFDVTVAASVTPDVGWHGMKIRRWLPTGIGVPVRSRSLPWVFVSRVVSMRAGDFTILFVSPASATGMLFSQEGQLKQSYRPLNLFPRIVDSPSSLENPISSATVQEVEDAVLEPKFFTYFAPVLAEIGRLAKLEEGWDSYGSSVIDRETRATAVKFLRMLSSCRKDLALPVVGPSASGGVVFQWWLPEREVAAEVSSDCCRYYAARLDEDHVREEAILAADELKELASRIARLLDQPMPG